MWDSLGGLVKDFLDKNNEENSMDYRIRDAESAYEALTHEFKAEDLRGDGPPTEFVFHLVREGEVDRDSFKN